MTAESIESVKIFKTLTLGESVRLFTGKNDLGSVTLESDGTLTYTTPEGNKWTLRTQEEITNIPDRQWAVTLGSLMDNVSGAAGLQLYQPHIQVVSADGTISRLHCRLEAHPGWVDIIDTSSNGLAETAAGAETTPAIARFSQIQYRHYPLPPKKDSINAAQGGFWGRLFGGR